MRACDAACLSLVVGRYFFFFFFLHDRHARCAALEVEDLCTNTVITVMTTVQYPTTTATLNWPAIFPANWKDIEGSLVNDGTVTKAAIEVQAQKDSGVVRNAAVLRIVFLLFVRSFANLFYVSCRPDVVLRYFLP